MLILFPKQKKSCVVMIFSINLPNVLDQKQSKDFCDLLFCLQTEISVNKILKNMLRVLKDIVKETESITENVTKKIFCTAFFFFFPCSKNCISGLSPSAQIIIFLPLPLHFLPGVLLYQRFKRSSQN